MIIEVTKADIKNAAPGNSWKCPIALALKRYFPGKGISVRKNQIALYPNESYVNKSIFGFIKLYPSLPRSAQRFISKFDAGKKVEPFRFILTSDHAVIFRACPDEFEGYSGGIGGAFLKKKENA